MRISIFSDGADDSERDARAFMAAVSAPQSPERIEGWEGFPAEDSFSAVFGTPPPAALGILSGPRGGQALLAFVGGSADPGLPFPRFPPGLAGSEAAARFASSLCAACVRNTAGNLKSFLEASGQRLFSVGPGGEILSCLPEEPFLGKELADFIGKTAAEALGYEAEAGASASKGKRLRLAECRKGDGTEATLAVVPIDPAAIPAAEPVAGGKFLLVSEASEYHALAAKHKRLEIIQDSIARSRAQELESANELLQNQALELRNALDLLEYRNRQMMEELGLASELQKSLLPKEFPSDLPLELCRKYMPLATVGGDFFDVSMVDPTHVGIIIADVSGHGVAPAFITAMLKSAYSHISPGELSPAEVMGRLNQEFARNLRTEHYLTGFYTIVDVESLECLYCNAGHPKQLLIRAGGGEEELETQGFFLGMFDGTTYEDGRVSLNPGDALCFFTDGIIEAKDAGGNQFDREGIVKSYRAHELESMEAISNALVQDLLEFTAGPELEDDLTFIAARVIESL